MGETLKNSPILYYRIFCAPRRRDCSLTSFRTGGVDFLVLDDFKKLPQQAGDPNMVPTLLVKVLVFTFVKETNKGVPSPHPPISAELQESVGTVN